MFGIFRPKTLNLELVKQNVSEEICRLFIDTSNLKYDKFESFSAGVQAYTDMDRYTAFLREKLRYIVAVVIISFEKAGVEEPLLDEVIDMAVGNIKSTSDNMTIKITDSLLIEAREYARVRFSAKPRVAGKMIENKFSEGAFGTTPEDIDSQYTLYKQLSSFERGAIFSIGKAIRKSRV